MDEPGLREEQANRQQAARASAGNPAEAASESSSGEELKELLARIERQALALARSLGRLAKAESTLALHYLFETMRLFFARGIILLHVWIFAAIAWVSLMYAIARGVYAASGGLPEASALVLFTIHASMLVILMAVYKRLKL